MMPKPDVQIVEDAFSAEAISVANCPHGSVYIRLHDRGGTVFAFGCVNRETAMALKDQISDAIGAADTSHHH